MKSLTLSEAVSTGLSTTVVGLLTVFSVLVILMLVLTAMKYIFAGGEKQKTKEVKITSDSIKNNAPEEDEEELIAILTAAVAASLNTSTYNLKIKSYRRVSNNASAWNRAGVHDTIDSRIS